MQINHVRTLHQRFLPIQDLGLELLDVGLDATMDRQPSSLINHWSDVPTIVHAVVERASFTPSNAQLEPHADAPPPSHCREDSRSTSCHAPTAGARMQLVSKSWQLRADDVASPNISPP